jgi:putative exosortase-associated protein (TIGR04073 family)
MKRRQLFIALVVAFLLALPLTSLADQPPELIVEKMGTKFARGMTNVLTCIVELPKQSVLTVRDLGAAGYVVGPLKGIGMTAYRAFIGAAEVATFLIPQPGYYDPMIDPAYVWEGWEARGDTSPVLEEEKQQPAPAQ